MERLPETNASAVAPINSLVTRLMPATRMENPMTNAIVVIYGNFRPSPEIRHGHTGT